MLIVTFWVRSQINHYSERSPSYSDTPLTVLYSDTLAEGVTVSRDVCTPIEINSKQGLIYTTTKKEI